MNHPLHRPARRAGRLLPLFGLLFTVAQTLTAYAAATPRIAFTAEKHHFGTVSQGATVRHLFEFRNAGQDTLQIRNIRTNCGCTAALASSRELAPGAVGQIEVSLNTAGRSGLFQQTVVVETNDPDRPMVNLLATADVTLQLGVMAPMLNFGRVHSGEMAAQYIDLTGTDREKARITSAVARSNFIRTEISAQGFDGLSDRRVKVSLAPGAPVGHFQDSITLQTDHPTVPMLQVHVVGEVLGLIAASPNIVNFGLFQRGEAQTLGTRIHSAGSQPFRILEVESTVPDLVCRVETETEGRTYRLLITIPEDFPRSFFSGRITLVTDNPEQDTVELRVSGRARPR